MTKAEFIDHVHGALDSKLTKKDTGTAVQAVFDALLAAIKRDGRISYPDFGTFTVKTRAARQGRNPRTGKTLTIAASKTVGFKAAPKLKTSI
ncbi:MAG: HU family DNA-binding protein [Deltaproteobacteria bacterium]|jgi:DNA-binding protein HU-beta|nr:HU family DNA-binding protein [Deltaproteobacteria bacterium]